MKHSIVGVLVFTAAALAVGSLDAIEEPIGGAWTLSVEQLAVKLVFEQKKSTITGTLEWPHGDPIKLTGLFADDTLIFSGDSAGANFTIHIDSTGTLKADGTLTGTLKAHFDEFNDAHAIVRARNQEIPWTATRGLHNLTQFPR